MPNNTRSTWKLIEYIQAVLALVGWQAEYPMEQDPYPYAGYERWTTDACGDYVDG
jgi:hypothetical protein